MLYYSEYFNYDSTPIRRSLGVVINKLRLARTRLKSYLIGHPVSDN